jgi:flagellar hook assembly protein FlgD
LRASAFNPETEIRFFVPRRVRVKIVVYNSLGHPIRLLVDRMVAAGEHGVSWNGRDDRGIVMASGIYLAKMSCENFSAIRKIVLAR